METKKPSPEEMEREKIAASAEPAPRVVPTYNSVSETKVAKYIPEPKPYKRREIVKR